MTWNYNQINCSYNSKSIQGGDIDFQGDIVYTRGLPGGIHVLKYYYPYVYKNEIYPWFTIHLLVRSLHQVWLYDFQNWTSNFWKVIINLSYVDTVSFVTSLVFRVISIFKHEV